MIVTREDVASELHKAGVNRGDNLLVHSSLSAMGWVEGGADAVIDGILDVIESEGTVMVPTFNYWATEIFDPQITCGLTGAISETLRRRSMAVRSLHPTHSVSAIGTHASEFTNDHDVAGALRVDSPVDRLAKANGWIVLLGVRHDSNSTVHVGEAYAKPWYLGFPFTASDPEYAKILDRGSMRTVKLVGRQSGCSVAFNAIELPLRKHGAIIDFKLGNAMCQLMRGQTVIDKTVELIHECEDILLCSSPVCFYCTNAMRQRHYQSSNRTVAAQ